MEEGCFRSIVGNGVTMLPRFMLNKRNNFIFVRILTWESISHGLGRSVPFPKENHGQDLPWLIETEYGGCGE